MKTMKATLTVLLFALALPTQSFAKPGILKQFKAAYPEAKVIAMKCALCHAGDNALNVFGDDIVKSLAANSGTIKWAELEQIDSDGDGYTNLEEYSAGTNPGDREDKPAAH